MAKLSLYMLVSDCLKTVLKNVQSDKWDRYFVIINNVGLKYYIVGERYFYERNSKRQTVN